MKREVKRILDQGVVEIVDDPRIKDPTRKILPMKWDFTNIDLGIGKKDEHGKPITEKGRLCVRGNYQTYGVDYNLTYSLTQPNETVLLLIVIATVQGMLIQNFNIKQAFLAADVEEEIYVQAFPGFSLPEGKVFLLWKALYSL